MFQKWADAVIHQADPVLVRWVIGDDTSEHLASISCHSENFDLPCFLVFFAVENMAPAFLEIVLLDGAECQSHATTDKRHLREALASRCSMTRPQTHS